jgi:hypothetical protein
MNEVRELIDVELDAVAGGSFDFGFPVQSRRFGAGEALDPRR